MLESMRKLIFVIPVLVLLAGAAWYGLMVYPEQRFRASLDLWARQLPPGVTASYRSAHYDWFSRQAVIEQLSVQAAAPAKAELTVDRIEVTDPNLALQDGYRAAAAHPDQVAPDSVVPVAGRIALAGLALHAPDVSVKLGSWTTNAIKLYPAAAAQAGGLSPDKVQAAVKAIEDQPSADQLLPILRIEAGWLLSASYGRSVGENLEATVKVRATGSTPASTVIETIRHATVTGYDRGALGESTVDGLVIHVTPGFTESLDRFSLGATDLRKPLGALMKADALKPELLDGLALGPLAYQGLSVKLPKNPPVKVAEIALTNLAFSGAVPVSGSFSLKGLHITRAALADTPAADGFDKLELKAVTVSVGIAFGWDLAQKRITVKDTFLKADELGSLNLSADVTDMAPGPGWDSRGGLAHAVLRYEDGSLVRRALKATAAQSGGDVGAARKQLIEMVQQQAAQLGNGPVVTNAVNAVVAFLKAPKTLTIELAPTQPVPFATLAGAQSMDPQQLATLLALGVTANQ